MWSNEINRITGTVQGILMLGRSSCTSKAKGLHVALFSFFYFLKGEGIRGRGDGTLLASLVFAP